MADLKTLREQRAKAITEARALNDLAEKEARELSGEESSRFDALIAESERLAKKIGTEERLRDMEREAALRQDEDEQRKAGGKAGGAGDKAEAFRKWLRTGKHGGALEERALQAGDGDDGGYITAPEMFVSGLIKFVDDDVVIRRLATVYQLGSAGSLGAAELTADPSDADWTTELSTGSEDTAMKFGRRVMATHPVAKRIKVSRELIRRAPSVESLVQQRLAYKFAVTEEKAYMTGNGNQRPLGIFTASAQGIPTARDISTGNTATAIGADGLIEAKYFVKAQYMRSGAWIFHRDAMKQIAKLKDGEGQYLFRPSIREGDGDILLGRPIYMSEFAPNTFTTGQYVGIFGDFSHYWIADALDMQMQRLDELYAETAQVGFIARKEGDGQPVLAEAFARVKLA